MTTSISVTLDDFTSDQYVYYFTSNVYLRIMRVSECFVYNTMCTPVAGYCIEFVVVDESGNETHTNQPDVIGRSGSVCTITPVSDTSLNGVPLSDDNLGKITFELAYDK
jgi:hypothetical protein